MLIYILIYVSTHIVIDVSPYKHSVDKRGLVQGTDWRAASPDY